MNNAKNLLLSLSIFIIMQQETILYSKSRSSIKKADPTFYIDKIPEHQHDHTDGYNSCHHDHHESNSDSSDEDDYDDRNHNDSCDCGCNETPSDD